MKHLHVHLHNTRDAGTSEGAKKAAQTRKLHSGPKQFVPGEKAKPRSAEEHLAQSNWHEQEASRRERAASAHAQRGRHGVAGSERDKAELHRVQAEHHLNMSEAKGK